MPIRINLLAEAQAEEDNKRRDPVKRAAWVGGFVVFLVLLWASTVYFSVVSAASTLAAQTARWKSLEKKFADATNENKKLGELEKKLAALSRFSTNRFLWGSVLNALQESTVDKVQVVRIRTTQSYMPIAATPELTIKGQKTPARPPASLERLSMTIDAKDYADPSEVNFSKFKEKLQEVPYFKHYFTKPESVRLANLSAANVAALELGRSFQTFTIECEFPETRRE